MKRAFMKSAARPCGGGIEMKCRNAFRPNTMKMSPSRLRTMMVRIFIFRFGWLGFLFFEQERTEMSEEFLVSSVTPFIPSVKIEQKYLRWFRGAQFQRALFTNRRSVASA